MQANNYWSSSSYAASAANAWIVNMNDGNVNANNKTNSNYVWPVRAGEWLPLFSFENLYRRYLDCRRHKRATVNALKFEIDAEEKLLALRQELVAGTWQPSRSVCFFITHPKPREIVAADFRDRVVHHVLIERLEALYEPVFIHDSYACRRGRGLHRAVDRLQAFVRRARLRGAASPGMDEVDRAGSRRSRRAFFMHLDIRNFFMTIDKQVLSEILARKVKDEPLLALARRVLFHDPTQNCLIKSVAGGRVPAHKSLFHARAGCGLPVGNLASQFFANLYLNELDQYVKHTLKCRYYLRYCDDFVIVDPCPQRLVFVKERIDTFVRERLHIALNPNHGQIQPVSNGIDFLGYIVHPRHRLVRRRVVASLKQRLEDAERRLVTRGPGTATYRYDEPVLDKLRATLASYWGHFRFANSARLRAAVGRRFTFLHEYFQMHANPPAPRFRCPAVFESVRRQYRAYERTFRGSVLFFQVGRFCEFYGPAPQALGLNPLKANRRGARYGFPLARLAEYARVLIAHGRPVVFIAETDRTLGRIKERRPFWRQCPLPPAANGAMPAAVVM